MRCDSTSAPGVRPNGFVASDPTSPGYNWSNYDTIVKQVEADQADLLVIGSRRLTKSERLHLGSVSESLLRHAPCSVLIVRGTRA